MTTRTLRSNFPPAVTLLVGAMLALAAWAAWQLPPATAIAVHFDINGQADAWTSHTTLGLLLYPGLATLTPLLLAGLRRVLPLEESSAQAFHLVTPSLSVTLALLLAMLQIAALRAAFGLGAPIGLSAMVLGALLVGVGNGMAKLRPNRWVGIRTPWTLANPRVWDQTHRFGGWVFVLCGLALLASSLLPLSSGQQRAWLFAVLSVAVLAPVLRSYQLSHRLASK